MRPISPSPPPLWVGALLWGTALGEAACALTAPVRPWGWQGESMLILGLGLIIPAFAVSRGMPRRRLLLPVVGVAGVLFLLVRVVLPALRGSSAG